MAKGMYFIFSAESKMPLWNVVRNFGIEDGELIDEGMIIKFGRSQYRVKRLFIRVKILKESKTCRICLSAENSPDNPLVNTLCKCSGTANAIHVECLQQWIQSKIKIRRRGFVTSYYWKPLHCEICKGKYPDIIQLPDGSKLQVMDIKYPNTSYIALQNEVLVKTNGNLLGIL
jgi:hypothetical protein